MATAHNPRHHIVTRYIAVKITLFNPHAISPFRIARELVQQNDELFIYQFHRNCSGNAVERLHYVTVKGISDYTGRYY